MINDNSSPIGLATVLPLAVVTVSNAVFFTITVAKIRKARKRQSGEFFKKSDRTNLYIYIKLSTITGVFWMLLILAEGLNNDVLRYCLNEIYKCKIRLQCRFFSILKKTLVDAIKTVTLISSKSIKSSVQSVT